MYVHYSYGGFQMIAKKTVAKQYYFDQSQQEQTVRWINHNSY